VSQSKRREIGTASQGKKATINRKLCSIYTSAIVVTRYVVVAVAVVAVAVVATTIFVVVVVVCCVDFGKAQESLNRRRGG